MTQPDPAPIYRLLLDELRRIRVDLMPPRSEFSMPLGINLSSADALIPLLERELGEGASGESLEAMAATDPLLARITFDPGEQLSRLAPIPWPDGLAPVPIDANPDWLPQVDCIVVTFTAAEARALADVLTPGVQSTEWNDYTDNWSEFEPMLTGRSPARFSKRLGSWHLSQVGTKRALCFKSELHPSTDGPELPLAKLITQIVGQAHPSLLISTGTAGGIGAATQLGDVLVTNRIHIDCTKQFKAEPWAHQVFTGAALAPGPHLAEVGPLIAANAARLRPIADRDPVVHTSGAVISCDAFLFDDAEDTFGLRAYDASALCEEMDELASVVAVTGMTNPPQLLSIRNASDPQVPQMANIHLEEAWAGKIYERYGYWCALGSVICCWAVVADL